MGLFTWLTCNWAETTDGNDGALHPVDIPHSVPDALALVENAIRSLPRWRIEAVSASPAMVKATRRTRLWRFVDDIVVRLEPIPGGTRIQARSQSRVGRGDFGQNRRNLIALLSVLRASVAPGQVGE
jgi:uncharacterized protein (DUF1499 family)